MQTLWQDLRYGIRMLFKNPVITVSAVLALAIGIGANSSIFSLVNSLLLSPLPFEEPEKIMRLSEEHRERGIGDAMSSGANYLDWQEQSQSFESIGLIDVNSYNLTGAGDPERVSAYLVTPSIFSVLGIQLELGRPLLSHEDQPGQDHVVVASYGLWKERFGSDPKVLGESIKLDGEAYTVIGVLPAGLGVLETEAKLWLPLPAERVRQDRDNRTYTTLARLRSDVSVEQAQAELDTIAAHLAREYPRSNANWGVVVEPLLQKVIRIIGQTFLVLHGAVAFVLLITCANVASLVLARGNARRKEISVRAVLGASRLRMVRQLLTENVLLALSGGLAGLLLTFWGIEFLKLIVPTPLVPFIERRGIDGNVLAFTLGLSVLAGLLFGLFPVLQACKLNLNETLKESGRSSSMAHGRSRFLSFLVVAEVAFSLILLIGAGLMVNSFWRLQHVDPGFDPENLLTMKVHLPDSRYPASEEKRVFFQEIVHRVENLPGVLSLAVAHVLPLTGGHGVHFEIDARLPLPEGPAYSAQIRKANHDYFAALVIPLLRGRYFREQEDNETNHRVIINKTTAVRFWPDQNPLGERLTVLGPQPRSYEIVGVVGDVKQFGLDSEDQPTIYVPWAQFPSNAITFAMRTDHDPLSLAQAVRQEVWAMDPDLAVYQVRTMDAIVAGSLEIQSLSTILLSLLSVLALLLSLTGIYGIMSYSVSERTHEVGIRMALGAQGRDVLELAMRKGVVLALIGVAIGLAAAFAMTRVMSGLLYEVSASDPATFLGFATLLVLVALAASYFPARRATKVDPMVALRYE
ncbi:ABC transporter permease [Acidobacteria bacterium AH-259-A15]|nr:ABC transporter permease [Acidobacteria bacterium AH-259-A15]